MIYLFLFALFIAALCLWQFVKLPRGKKPRRMSVTSFWHDGQPKTYKYWIGDK
jgi:hypothetical protein